MLASRRCSSRASALQIVGAVAILALTIGGLAKRADRLIDGAEVDIIYWDDGLNRATAIFRMLDAADVRYNHIWDLGFPVTTLDQDVTYMFSSDWYHAKGKPAATGTSFAPPAVRDGDFFVSQSVAVVMYLGQKYGFDRSSRDTPLDNLQLVKAVQYMNDLADLYSEFWGKVMATKALAAKGLGVAADGKNPMKVFLEGGRFLAWLGNIERSIKGAYYFGTLPTYVDFYLLQLFDCMQDMALDILKPKTGYLQGPYPKILAVVAALRSAPSYKSGPKYTIKGLPQDRPDVMLFAKEVALYPENTD